MASTYSDQNNQIVPKYEHSERISFRRKALFPVDSEDSNSDLGPMSPLSDSNCDSFTFKNGLSQSRMDDYVMLDDSAELDDEDLDISTYAATICDTPSSVNLNLTCNDSRSPFCCNRLKDRSPSKTLLTPHDTSTTNTQIPRLSRKSQSEDADEEVKVEAKNPKARTALFMELPAKSFYPKAEGRRSLRVFKSKEAEVQKIRNKSTNLYLCSRRKRNALGQINAGVRHNIKKPRVKHAKIISKNVPMTKTESAQLVEYIKDLKDLTKSVQKQIKPLQKNDNKENQPIKNRGKKIENKHFNSAYSEKVSEIIKDFNDEENMDINKIINNLDAQIQSDEIVPKVSEKVAESENFITPHHAANGQPSYKDRKRKHEEIADMLLSPTSQMCDMTSEMAINSPKRAKLNINSILESNERISNVFNKISSSSAMEKKRLFPIFYAHNDPGRKETNGSPRVTASRKWNKIAPDQMLLDAGQKRFGFTQCPTCELVYHMGNPSEEEKHTKYHNGTHVLKFKGWKNERVVGVNGNDRIIQILPTDSKLWIKKVRDLMEIVNRELGFYEASAALENGAVYLYVKNKNVAGCVVVESRSSAYKMLSSVEDIDLCSEESFPIKCAVQRIWVAEGFRRHGIATALLDSVRKNFSYGYVLQLEDIGLSTPTELGKIFAVKYFKTNNYLVCTM